MFVDSARQQIEKGQRPTRCHIVCEQLNATNKLAYEKKFRKVDGDDLKPLEWKEIKFKQPGGLRKTKIQVDLKCEWLDGVGGDRNVQTKKDINFLRYKCKFCDFRSKLIKSITKHQLHVHGR